MPEKSRRGPLHFIDALRFSFRGLAAGWAHAEAFRQELFFFAAGVVLAVVFGENALERAVLIGVMFPVLAAELFNTAVETIVDRIGPEHNELSGRAKDMASAGVFITILGAAAVWGLVLFG